MHSRSLSAALLYAVSWVTLGSTPGAMPQFPPVKTTASPCDWLDLSPLPSARVEGPTLVIDGRIYVFGGFYNKAVQATPQVDVYDPASDTWSRASDMPLVVTHVGVARDEREIWFVGGFEGDHPGAAIDAVWIYDIDADGWSPGPPLPDVRAGGGAAIVGRGLHYFGGLDASRDTDHGEHWRLDLDNPLLGWSPRAPLPSPRNHLGAIEHAGLVYAIGGQQRHDSNPIDRDSVHAYNPATDSWSSRARLPFPRSHFEPGLFEHGGRLVVCGGKSSQQKADSIADVVAYDPATNRWSALAPLPDPLRGPGVKVLGERMYVFGGALPPFDPIDAVRRHVLGAPSQVIVRMNAGGDRYDSVSGDPWCADYAFAGGARNRNDQIPDIQGTPNDELYRSERTGANPDPRAFAYGFPVPGGTYRVALLFAEIFHGATGGGPGGVGRRVFDLSLEGALALDDYDIFADVGAERAVVKTFDVVVNDGVLDIEFQASVDRPSIGGILVLRHPGPLPSRIACSVTREDALLLWADGPSSVATDDLTLRAEGLPAGSAAVFLAASERSAQPFGDGATCLAGDLRRVGVPRISDAQGRAATHVTLSRLGATPGSSWRFQLVYRDAATRARQSSDAIAVSFHP